MPVMSVARFERFFRIAAGLDVDKKETEEELPGIVGGLTVALARTFKVHRSRSKEPTDDALGARLKHL